MISLLSLTIFRFTVGSYTWADGTRHIGEFKADQADGFGVEVYTDGTVFEGRWENGRSVEGQYTHPAKKTNTAQHTEARDEMMAEGDGNEQDISDGEDSASESEREGEGSAAPQEGQATTARPATGEVRRRRLKVKRVKNLARKSCTYV